MRRRAASYLRREPCGSDLPRPFCFAFASRTEALCFADLLAGEYSQHTVADLLFLGNGPGQRHVSPGGVPWDVLSPAGRSIPAGDPPLPPSRPPLCVAARDPRRPTPAVNSRHADRPAWAAASSRARTGPRTFF